MSTSIKSKTLLIFLAVIIIITGGIAIDKIGFLNPIKGGVNKVTSPFQLALSQSGKNVASFFHLLTSVKSISQENQSLQDANATLVSENVKLKEIERENAILRKQLKFKQQTNYRLIEADVINRDPISSIQNLTINKGKKDGIKKELAVTLNGALIGKISEVSDYTSKVLLITDQTSIVNSTIQDSRATGVIKGQLGYGLKMELIPQNTVIKEGDIVITSGLGGILPKGLIIGSIDVVEKADNEIFQTATIKPTINFKNTENVFIILGKE